MVKHYAKYISIGLVLALTGCATTQSCVPVIQTEPVNVYIPIDQTQVPPDVVPPVLYASTLTPAQKADIGELSKAANVTIVQLEGYITQLKAVVDKWKQLAAQNVPVVNATSSAPGSSAPVK